MKLFKRKEITEEEVIKAAEELILSQLKTFYSYGDYRNVVPAPAEQFAYDLVKKQMEKTDVKEAVNRFLESKALDKIIKEHVTDTIKNILTEQLIEGIVKKINKLQVKTTR